jgi:hypothetical protein
MNQHLTHDAMTAFEPDQKIGILATRDTEGLPHLSLITTLRAKDPTHLMWGQFCEGHSKDNVRLRPETAFAVMTMDRQIWRGKARWTHEAQEGADYELFNQSPMFRYNAYFGIHTVHYMDLLAVSGPESLSLPGLAAGMVSTAATRRFSGTGLGPAILKPWAQRLLARPDTLKFLAWIGPDGFPELIPVVPCQTADSRRLVFAPTVYRDQLQRLVPGETVALLGLNLAMESVLTRGLFTGYRPALGPGLGTGAIDLHWVYNSMPPKHGVIYPAQPLDPVTTF